MTLFPPQRVSKQWKIFIRKTYFRWFLTSFLSHEWFLVTKNHRKYDLTQRTIKPVVLLIRLRSLVVLDRWATINVESSQTLSQTLTNCFIFARGCCYSVLIWALQYKHLNQSLNIGIFWGVPSAESKESTNLLILIQIAGNHNLRIWIQLERVAVFFLVIKGKLIDPDHCCLSIDMYIYIYI